MAARVAGAGTSLLATRSSLWRLCAKSAVALDETGSSASCAYLAARKYVGVAGKCQFSIFFFSAAIWTISLLMPFRLTRVVKSSVLNGY